MSITGASNKKSRNSLKFSTFHHGRHSKKQRQKPSDFPRYSNVSNTLTNTTRIYHSTQQSTLRYSPTRINNTSMGQQHCVIKKNQCPNTFSAVQTSKQKHQDNLLDKQEMVLHVNDYNYEQQNLPRQQMQLNFSGSCDRKGKDVGFGGNPDPYSGLDRSELVDAYEESSGYSSSHAHIKSCHNLEQNFSRQECYVWEQHNSC